MLNMAYLQGARQPRVQLRAAKLREASRGALLLPLATTQTRDTLTKHTLHKRCRRVTCHEQEIGTAGFGER